MEITFIEHSCFLIEWENSYWIFDYYNGKLPEFDNSKTIFVFSSHNHGDHFNSSVLDLQDKYDNVTYIFSHDIKYPGKQKKYSEGLLNNILTVKPNKDYSLFDIKNNELVIKTLRSTDEGVAFILVYNHKTIYHAGDLNLWIWKGESLQYNNNMKALFEKEMQNIVDLNIDIAFAPLDPRQEEYYDLGILKFINTAKVKYLFPMHLWGKFDYINKFINEHNDLLTAKNVSLMNISNSMQAWHINN